jgi:hypothetical protein
MEIDVMYVKGVIDSTIDEYEQINSPIDEDKDLLITVEPFYGSQKVVIGAKVNISAVTSIIKRADNYGIIDVKKEYYDNYIIIYKSEKLGSFKTDLIHELMEIDKFKISDY